ncbi:AraC family transcriptional regulator [Enterovibrio makurazakiensis]|uniref:AraC family transcriptional regulator n=1 Tax=Enterovibrio gelatinilyticus TaxID=2899819 RepID=A0ABT5QXY8_9GAMM|nr:AraC family transcriptional regulator [Enterovibrio sp. ZSDZ42]MDD1792147.1 AraC family transcriptional regulator [Enterovibrio sp. ZSDZ42]
MQFESFLADQVAGLVEGEGCHSSTIEGMNLFLCSSNVSVIPIVLQPAICFVLRGQKRVITGKSSYIYNANSYLINSVTRPVEATLSDVSKDRPYVGVSLAIDQHLVGQLMMEMAPWQQESTEEQQMALTHSTNLTEPIAEVIQRLVDTLDNPMDQEILSGSLKRELYYQVLKGPCGGLLRNSVSNHAGANRIARVVHYLEQHFERNIDIEEITRVAGMSSSTLHEHFRKVTSVSPMQYVKSLRLHKARSMLSSGLQVAEVSYGVGYSSPSQFSREFKRYFGFTPSEARSLIGSLG